MVSLQLQSHDEQRLKWGTTKIDHTVATRTPRATPDSPILTQLPCFLGFSFPHPWPKMAAPKQPGRLTERASAYFFPPLVFHWIASSSLYLFLPPAGIVLCFVRSFTRSGVVHRNTTARKICCVLTFFHRSILSELSFFHHLEALLSNIFSFFGLQPNTEPKFRGTELSVS